MLGYDRSVSSRMTYMAICRAVTSGRCRCLLVISSIVKPNCFGRLVEDELGGDGPGLVLAQQVGENLGGAIDREGLVGEAGEGGHADERALEHPDVVLDVGRR